MKEAIALLGGLGVGALLMYLLDPDRGNRRRGRILDKMVKLNQQTVDAMNGKAKDLSNRAKDLLHEAKTVFELEEDDLPYPPRRYS